MPHVSSHGDISRPRRKQILFNRTIGTHCVTHFAASTPIFVLHMVKKWGEKINILGHRYSNCTFSKVINVPGSSKGYFALDFMLPDTLLLEIDVPLATNFYPQTILKKNFTSILANLFLSFSIKRQVKLMA